jgi:hypothetical protein
MKSVIKVGNLKLTKNEYEKKDEMAKKIIFVTKNHILLVLDRRNWDFLWEFLEHVRI